MEDDLFSTCPLVTLANESLFPQELPIYSHNGRALFYNKTSMNQQIYRIPVLCTDLTPKVKPTWTHIKTTSKPSELHKLQNWSLSILLDLFRLLTLEKVLYLTFMCFQASTRFAGGLLQDLHAVPGQWCDFSWAIIWKNWRIHLASLNLHLFKCKDTVIVNYISYNVMTCSSCPKCKKLSLR